MIIARIRKLKASTKKARVLRVVYSKRTGERNDLHPLYGMGRRVRIDCSGQPGGPPGVFRKSLFAGELDDLSDAELVVRSEVRSRARIRGDHWDTFEVFGAAVIEGALLRAVGVRPLVGDASQVLTIESGIEADVVDPFAAIRHLRHRDEHRVSTVEYFTAGPDIRLVTPHRSSTDKSHHENEGQTMSHREVIS